MTPLPITHATLTTALGAGLQAHLAAVDAQRSGLRPCAFEDVDLPGWIGRVEGLEDAALPPALHAYEARNNRLAVLLGTSTSAILESEHAYRQRGEDGALPREFSYAHTHSTASLAHFVAEALGLAGPCWVVSTACSSSAKVFGDAARLIEAGWIDAAVVGGVDSLCLTTLYGFHSLQLFSPDVCRPWDAGRNGISLGEGAAFALLQRDAAQAPLGRLLGVGESSDGYHMSSPHPEGALAAAAMRQALAAAGLAPGDIDYINLHGTGTPSNDASEDRAVQSVFGREVPCSSTKAATGHTLGAAGGVEAVISLLALRHGILPGGLHVRERDPGLGVNYLQANRAGRVRHVLSNSFGFGGSNASLVLGAA
jgi:3-oxoacyl-[acyl-carrier-protein] synthase-1